METYHCNFIEDPDTLRPPLDPIIPTTPETVALAAVATRPVIPPTSKPYPDPAFSTATPRPGN